MTFLVDRENDQNKGVRLNRVDDTNEVRAIMEAVGLTGATYDSPQLVPTLCEILSQHLKGSDRLGRELEVQHCLKESF